MVENLDAILADIEQSAPAPSSIPPIDDRFTDPCQIARTLSAIYNESWEYLGAFYTGGLGDIHMIGCGNSLRPIYQDASGEWFVAYRDWRRYGEPDRAGTLMLLKFAQENQTSAVA